ncbi:response regulator transcription factor [Paenibacillus paeoniae]|uniref:DNA-binding response regulator n=1 Tax=Paenibacillus paeoniae TaxID=2292705 RepID=A0A371PMX7_9BACL|nr:response regulator transcription factor [Paenibacillus paeoniae]REK77556.1 DNA-binding response regulator [Paenibacillus paeoniae]
MSSYRIAVVDDDLHIRNLVEAYLVREDFETIGLATAEEALELWRNDPPDMWVLDIMLPGMDGYEFCRTVRREADVPIIMISARDNEVDKIMGLELGGDDYMVKPFSPRELVARVKRQIHRWYKVRIGDEGVVNAPASSDITIGELKLSIEERRVFWDGSEVEITLKEFALLHTLSQHPNRAFSRDDLLAIVWGDDYFGSDRAVDHLVKRIRKKIMQLPIEAVWGHGYRLRHEGGERG